MKCLLSVCLAGSILTAVAIHSAVLQSSVQAHATQAQPMQRGVSVEMASANYTQAWPQADDSDAWVVTVDNSGQLYFGLDPMTPKELEQWMIQHPRRRDQKLYIKADARAAYAGVEKALEAASDAEFSAPVLLVNQRDGSTAPGNAISPKGWEVAVGSATPSGMVATLVELVLSGQRQPLVRVNNDEIPWSALGETLKQHFHQGDDQVVLLRANRRLPFAEVAHAIDNCRAAGARVYLAEPEL